MSLIESNSTKLLLPVNGVYQGRAVRPDVKYITIQITATFEGGNSGLLEIYYSIDGIFYDTFGDSWTYTTETNKVHVFKETQMKGSFFYVKWTNNGISSYTSFNLNTKLAETTSTVSVDGVVNIPEVNVNIEGQTVFSKIRDTAGNALNSTDNALNVDVKNTVDISGSVNVGNFPSTQNVSGNVNITNSSLPVTGTFFQATQPISGSVSVSNFPATQPVSGSVSVSNFPATQNVSGSVSVSNQISGYSTSALQTTGNDLLTDIKTKTLNSNTDSVTVYAGGENGLNIRYLASDVDSVDAGLSTYAWSNSNPPFPATRDVLGAQLCGVNNLAGDNLINLVSNASGHLIVNVDNQPTSIQVSNFPAIQDVSGNVNITNSSLAVTGAFYPAIQDISGNVNITNSSLAVTGTFYPAIQDVSGSVNVGNFPATQNVSGNVNITNSSLAVTGAFYPAIQDISGNVNITNSSLAVTGTFYPAIQDVSGSVNVGNFPATQNVSGSVNVGNFPATQNVSGSISVSNFPATQNVSGNVTVNTISGFALETGGNLASIKTNSDKLKYVGDDLKAIISNTSFDSKLRDGNNNIVTSTAYGIDGVRALDVSIKNATQAEPLVVEIPTTNIINTFSTNLPASYPIDAGGALSSAIGALYVNLRDTTGNAYGVTGAPLVVESNLITGFALESGGNLASIKTNTDKFKFTGNYLSCEVVNAGTNALSVTETNPITGFALETGGNLAAIKTNTDKNNYDASGNLKVNLATGSISVSSVNIKDSSGNNIYADASGYLKTNIQNSSLNTYCYGSSDGTTWHHLLTNPNGKLQTNAGVQDNNGNDITSTLNGAKRSLDVNVANTGSLKVDISGSTIVDGKLAVVDTNAFPYIQRISVGAGADIFSYAFGNFLTNTTINTGAVSTTITFAAGSYGRRVMLMYRDGATSSTDSITYYTDSNSGTPEPLLLQTVYPIVNNGYRWSNVIINILPFSSLKIRNDSTTINNTAVYLTVVRV